MSLAEGGGSARLDITGNVKQMTNAKYRMPKECRSANDKRKALDRTFVIGAFALVSSFVPRHYAAFVYYKVAIKA
jgi:hypothetical protein